jgi:hypothetical protein
VAEVDPISQVSEKRLEKGEDGPGEVEHTGLGHGERQVADQCGQQRCEEGGIDVVRGVREGERGHIACLEIGAAAP